MASTSHVLPVPNLAEVALPSVLFALSDPTRLDLVRRLAAAESLQIADCYAITPTSPKSTFSHHLKTLREAGLITNEPDGRRRRIALRRAELDERFPGLIASVLGPAD